MDDAIGPDCSNVGGAKTSVCIDSSGMMDDNRLGRVKSKVDIIAREKQTDDNREIYYGIHLSKNRTPITLDKTKKTFMLISS